MRLESPTSRRSRTSSIQRPRRLGWVHPTPDLEGQARFGPGVQRLDADGPGGIDYRVDEDCVPAFEASIRRCWPGPPAGALAPAYSGVRP